MNTHLNRKKPKGESDCVLTLRSIGEKIYHHRPIPFDDIESLKESSAVNYCAVLELMFGAEYNFNVLINAYEPKGFSNG